jgi:ubiquinone/menaquinone biosynthesis C-methylase UbiE
LPRKGETRVDKAGVAEEYSSMAPNYNVGSLATRREGQERIRHLVRRGDVVLDVGCGPGFALPMEARYSGKRGKVLAVDISLEMLLEARKCFSKWFYPERKFDYSRSRVRGLTKMKKDTAPVFFLLCDAERLPIKSGTVDTALSFTSIHRMSPSTVLSEMWRVLSPGGYILFDVPGSHDADAMVFQHIPPSYLPDKLPRGFPPDFKLDPAYWKEEQRSWTLFKDYCSNRLPWLAERISHGWFNGYESLREKYNQFRNGKITEEELEEFIEDWEMNNDSRKLGWICFPTRRAFASLLEELEEKGAVVVESTTSSFKPNMRRLMRTGERIFELYVYIYSQVVRSHTAILWKPPWT